MNDIDFVAGDVVILKSGGPDMTIVMIHKQPDPDDSYKDNVMCTWSYDGCIHNNTFPRICLKRRPQDVCADDSWGV